MFFKKVALDVTRTYDKSHKYLLKYVNQGERLCNVCKQIKSEEEFSYQNKEKGTRHYKCKSCISKLRTIWTVSRILKNTTGLSCIKSSSKKKIIDYVLNLKQQPCTDCKRHYPHYVMEFDHTSKATKSFNIGMISKLKVTLLDVVNELSKCELVCANCHKVRTYTRKDTINTRYLM